MHRPQRRRFLCCVVLCLIFLNKINSLKNSKLSSLSYFTFTFISHWIALIVNISQTQIFYTISNWVDSDTLALLKSPGESAGGLTSKFKPIQFKSWRRKKNALFLWIEKNVIFFLQMKCNTRIILFYQDIILNFLFLRKNKKNKTMAEEECYKCM